MPGCRRRADLCDLDHTTPWPTGPTTASNLGPLCRRHHNQKTRRRWHLANTTGPLTEPHPDDPGPPDPSESGDPREAGDPSGGDTTGYVWTTPTGTTITDTITPPLE
jgi:hypothetical protein